MLRRVSGRGSCRSTSEDLTSAEESWSLLILCWPRPTASPGDWHRKCVPAIYSTLQDSCLFYTSIILFILGTEFTHCNWRNEYCSAAVPNAELIHFKVMIQIFKVLYAENINANAQSVHCFPLCGRSNSLSLSAENWKVYGGTVSLDRLPQPYLVKKILLNENYNSKTNDQDIALLKLTSPVVFNGQC